MPTEKGNSEMTLLERQQAKRGFILAVRLARLIGKHHSTVYRWIANSKVESELIDGNQFVRMLSVRDHLGEQAFKLLKLHKVYNRMKADGVVDYADGTAST